MMLDKSQIKDWDGEPEDPAASHPPAAKPAVESSPASPDQAPPEASAQPLSQKQAQPAVDAALTPTQDQRRYGEARATGETVHLSPQEEKARKRRGQWLALGLLAFVILVFMLTMTKMGAQILVRDL